MSICLVRVWKTGLWDKTMDSWLYPFSNIGVKLLLARIDNKGIIDRMRSRFSLLGAGIAMLANDLEGISFFCLIVLTLICSIFLLSYRTFISVFHPAGRFLLITVSSMWLLLQQRLVPCISLLLTIRLLLLAFWSTNWLSLRLA